MNIVASKIQSSFFMELGAMETIHLKSSSPMLFFIDLLCSILAMLFPLLVGNVILMNFYMILQMVP